MFANVTLGGSSNTNGTIRNNVCGSTSNNGFYLFYMYENSLHLTKIKRQLYNRYKYVDIGMDFSNWFLDRFGANNSLHLLNVLRKRKNGRTTVKFDRIISKDLHAARWLTRSNIMLIVFVCLYITPSHYHHCANLFEDIGLIKCLSDIFCRVCKIERIFSITHYTMNGAVCFQFTHFPCDDWENIHFVL